MIRHILADGTEVEDITGHKVMMADVPMVYEVLKRIGERYEENISDSDAGRIDSGAH